MAAVVLVPHDGQKHDATLEEGRSLMQVAIDNAVPAWAATAERATCGTCHVIVDP